MNRQRVSTRLRIIWAIGSKDILDALKNKTTLVNMFTVAFLLVFYRVMPILSGSYPPGLALYDAGESGYATGLAASDEVDLREMPSLQALEQNIGSRSIAVLGLVLPADLDQRIQTASDIELQGYVDHWVSSTKVAELQAHFERLLTDLTGKPVHIEIESETVYTNPHGMQAMIVSLSIVLTLFIFGVSVTPMLMFEEKETRTLDALLVSPATSAQVVLGKALTGMFYCLTTAALVLAFNAHLIIHWGWAILATICGATFLVAAGLLLGSLGKGRQQAIWTLILAQPLLIPVGLSVLGNALSAKVQAVMNLIPTVALGKILRLAVSQESITLVDVGLELVIILASSTLLLGIVARLVQRADR